MERRRIVIIQAHPDPASQRLCRGLGDSYAAGAREAGHQVEVVDLATLPIPLLSSQHEFEHQPVPDALRPACDAIRAAHHIVLVFPLWLGCQFASNCDPLFASNRDPSGVPGLGLST